eukprot:91879_1
MPAPRQYLTGPIESIKAISLSRRQRVAKLIVNGYCRHHKFTFSNILNIVFIFYIEHHKSISKHEKVIDSLNAKVLNADDFVLIMECAKKIEKICNPYIFVISYKSNNNSVIDANYNNLDNISIIVGKSHTNTKQQIAVTLKQLTTNIRLSKYDGIIVVLLCVAEQRLNEANVIPRFQFYYDQYNEKRSIHQLKNDFIVKIKHLKLYIHYEAVILNDNFICDSPQIEPLNNKHIDATLQINAHDTQPNNNVQQWINVCGNIKTCDVISNNINHKLEAYEEDIVEKHYMQRLFGYCRQYYTKPTENKSNHKLYHIQRFSTQKLNSIINDNKTSNCSYSYSYPFNYWKQCKNLNTLCFNDMTYSDLYIAPKYKNLKDELLAHANCLTHSILYFTLSLEEMKSEYVRKIVANCEKYLPKLSHFPDHPSHFGYKDGEPIPACNICCIKIYCMEDKFQLELCETYRSIMDKESFESIKRRHGEFHHFARILKETVEVFGTQYIVGDIKRMY